MLNKSTLMIVPRNSYIDFDDLDTPLKTYLDDSLFYAYEQSTSISIDLKVKKLREIDNRLLQIGEIQKYEFYSMQENKNVQVPGFEYLAN